MSARSMHFCFQLKGGAAADDELMKKIKGIPDLCLQEKINDVTIKDYGKSLGNMVIAMAEDGSTAVIRTYPSGLLTLDLQREMEHSKHFPINDEVAAIKNLELKIKRHLGSDCKFSRSVLGQIMRGELCPYGSTGADLLMEYMYTSLLFEKDSSFQNIKIYQSKEYGSVLCLDDDVMIGDSDLIYTHTLLGVGRNDFNDKTVLILGGGDGGTLHEVLKLHPRHVLMAEIDEEVIKACRVYMRKTCHDALDKYEGANFKIHIGDCVEVLKESIASGKQYDYIINDLTECLVGGDTALMYDIEASSTILEISKKILAPTGKFLSRGNTLSAVVYREKVENDIRSLGMDFKTFVVHVPSYQERYCLYEAWIPEQNQTK